jgi:putative molybdopterin biosynthesis protein
LEAALDCDGVILSGGTSKGSGDLSYQVVGALDDPGIVVHGVAIKPGKPLCLAATGGKPVVILPGFPTSAMVTFHQVVAPVLRTLAGLPAGRRQTVAATLPTRVSSEPGRTEYLLVGLIGAGDGYAAYPIGKGSGSVTSFGHADGYIEVAAPTEVLPADSPVEVVLLSDAIAPADLVSIGSHCVGLDHLLQILQGEGVTAKYLSVGSQAGVAAARRGECDIAGIHLMDPATGVYNRHFVDERVVLVPGYLRLQGVTFRADDARFEGAATAAEAVARALADRDAIMVNRNAGSGTRVLVDRLLGGAEPPGYAVQPSSHNAVAAAVAQGRADWGVTIETVARQYGLGFLPLQEEHYDFLVPRSRWDRPTVARFVELLRDPAARAGLEGLGFRFAAEESGEEGAHD